MKCFLPAFLLLLFACNNTQTQKGSSTSDALSDTVYSTVPSVPDTLPAPVPEWEEMDQLLSRKFGGSLVITRDTAAQWDPGEFDYFIKPKRKVDPAYPYYCKGDFNGDGETDAAALVKSRNKSDYQLAICFGQPLDPHRIIFWTEDIDRCAISTHPKGALQGIGQPAVRMQGDGIQVEFFERASFVLYWDGKKFKRAQTGD